MGKRPGLIDNNENHYGPLGYSGVIRPGGWRELILRKKKHCYTQVNNLVQLVSKKNVLHKHQIAQMLSSTVLWVPL